MISDHFIKILLSDEFTYRMAIFKNCVFLICHVDSDPLGYEFSGCPITDPITVIRVAHTVGLENAWCDSQIPILTFLLDLSLENVLRVFRW